MGVGSSRVGQAIVLFALGFLLSFDFHSLGFTSTRGIVAVQVLGLLAALGLFRRPLAEKFRQWRSAPALPFPEIATAGVARATARALPLYLLATAVVLAPMWPHFCTHVFADTGDGLQMVWNVWWFQYALFSGENPFYTEYLHYPSGITLWGASYHPLKNLLVAPLVPLIGLTPSYNLLFVGTLVGCSLSAFALSFAVSRSFVGSLAAGLAFGFWNNRFAHLNGHMHTVSTELLPLFLLCLLLFWSKPTIRRSFWLSALLLGSLFSDHYAFLFCVFLFGVVFAWAVFRRGIRFLLQAPYFAPLAAFSAFTIATSGLLSVYILSLSRSDPWGGAHGPRENSMDLLAPFIPGAYSWMAPLTKEYWSYILSGEIEGSIYPGLTLLVMAALACRALRPRRADSHATSPRAASGDVDPTTGNLAAGDAVAGEPVAGDPGASPGAAWVGVLALAALFFWILSLGPWLQVWGYETPLSLPYLFVERAFPFLRMSGVPVRFTQPAVLATAALAAIYLSTVRRKTVVFLAMCLLALDLVPKLPAMSALDPPKFVLFLKDLPEKPAVIDTATYMTNALYYQTIHEKPLAFGYVARVPRSRQQAEDRFREVVKNGDWPTLQAAGFKYVVLPKATKANLPIAFQDETFTVYSLVDQ